MRPSFGMPCHQCARAAHPCSPPAPHGKQCHIFIPSSWGPRLTRRVIRFLTGRVSRPRLGHKLPPIFDREALRASAHSLPLIYPFSILLFYPYPPTLAQHAVVQPYSLAYRTSAILSVRHVAFPSLTRSSPEMPRVSKPLGLQDRSRKDKLG